MTPEDFSGSPESSLTARSISVDESRTAADVMSRAPRTCSTFSTVTEAVLIFKSEDCGMVPVVDAEGKPVGVVTDRDIALALANHPDLTDRPISEIMSTDPLMVKPDLPLPRVAQIMAQQQIRRILVVDDEGRLVGVVAWADVAPSLSDKQTGEMVSEVVEKSGER